MTKENKIFTIGFKKAPKWKLKVKTWFCYLFDFTLGC